MLGSYFFSDKALKTNGVDQYAFVDNPSFKSNTQGFVEFYYRPTTVLTTTDFQRLFGLGVLSGANNAMWVIGMRHNGSVNIAPSFRNQPIPEISSRIIHNGTNNIVYGEHIYVAGTLAHWVYQSDGSTCSIWRNAVQLPANRWAGTNTGHWMGHLSGTSHRFTIGAGFQANAITSYSDGRYNEVRIGNAPLTSGEIAWLYNGGFPRNPHRASSALKAKIQAWYRMGNTGDTAGTIYNEWVDQDHLTLVNTTLANYDTP